MANGIVSHNCYARDIAMRFDGDFEPKFHEDRLNAPADTKVPKGRESEAGISNVFVCSMADLFGDWVDKKWIDIVISVCKEQNGWNYLFLTKNPKRYLEFEFPENCWLGASATNQNQFNRATNVFKQMTNNNIKFLSCEPLNERIEAYDLNVDWLIIGSRSKSSGMPAFHPEWEWVEHLLFQARKKNVQVYFKPNLTARPMEYPKK
jgi:protein gp37